MKEGDREGFDTGVSFVLLCYLFEVVVAVLSVFDAYFGE